MRHHIVIVEHKPRPLVLQEEGVRRDPLLNSMANNFAPGSTILFGALDFIADSMGDDRLHLAVASNSARSPDSVGPIQDNMPLGLDNSATSFGKKVLDGSIFGSDLVSTGEGESDSDFCLYPRAILTINRPLTAEEQAEADRRRAAAVTAPVNDGTSRANSRPRNTNNNGNGAVGDKNEGMNPQDNNDGQLPRHERRDGRSTD